MPNSATLNQAFLTVACDLTSDVSEDERLRRLLEQLHKVIPCDASALFTLHDNHLTPRAIQGLPREVLGRRLSLSQHHRLRRILEGDDVTLFGSDDPSPDPFDGMISVDGGDEGSSVHSCMGAPLVVGDRTWGVITVDALGEEKFTPDVVERFRYFAAIAAASLPISEHLGALQRRVNRSHALVADLVQGESHELIGKSPSITRLLQEANLVAGSDLTALITGETGTGKELVARQIHRESARSNRQFVAVNCAALPEGTADAELFGHTRGAFTGAAEKRLGKFELADGGTLLLDEIGELSPNTQAKLLRTVQFGEIQRVGSDRTIQVDVRVIASTNRDLEKLVQEGQFRADLYHRLSVFPIHVPPLRERVGDIELLAGHFVEKHQRRLGTPPIRLSQDAIDKLNCYSWPGNVRELEHVLLRSVLPATMHAQRSKDWLVLSASDIDIEPDCATHEHAGLREATRAFQVEMIKRALRDTNNNYAEAARKLKMDRSNLHRLAARLGIK